MSTCMEAISDTQQSDDVVFSQDVLEDGWGVLCSTRRSYRTLVMIKNEYSVGRSADCDVVFKSAEQDLNSLSSTQVGILEPQHKILTYSKVHFKITRDSSVVYLEDFSSNGTYVNEVIVGRRRKIILQNNDEISLSHPKHKYFVYIDRQPYTTIEAWSTYPSDLKDNYFISKSLGSGSYGEVKLVLHKRTFVKYAMKVIEMKNIHNHGNSNEVDILKSLDNPFVIKYEHVIKSPSILFIFLEYMEGGDLFKRIQLYGKLTEISTKWIFFQLAIGVEYLHDQGIAHRDLKPENILLSSEDDFPIVKISDFGLSKFFNSVSVLKTLCGTPLYVAPEILETKGRGVYSNVVDVWSLGVILFACLSGGLPFNMNREDMSLDEQIRRGNYSFSSLVWRNVSPSAKGLISRMMTVNPKLRITVKMVKVHPWLKDKELIGKLKQREEFRSLNLYESNEPLTNNENEPPTRKRRLC